VDECKTLEADAQWSEFVKPRDCSLNPACFAQPPAVRLATSGYFSGDAGFVQRAPPIWINQNQLAGGMAGALTAVAASF
jgi:hypothetical protein